MCCFGLTVLVKEFAKLELTGIEHLCRGAIPVGSQCALYIVFIRGQSAGWAVVKHI